MSMLDFLACNLIFDIFVLVDIFGTTIFKWGSWRQFGKLDLENSTNLTGQPSDTTFGWKLVLIENQFVYKY